MNNKLLKIGFVGAGSHSTACIYPSLHLAPCRLIAVADLDENKAKEAGRKFGAERTYADYKKMFRREKLDAVFCVGGPELHYRVALDALDAGLHVFIEKPPCRNAAEAGKMLEKSRAAGKQIMTGFMKRFATANQLAKEITQRKEFGGIKLYQAKFTTGQYAREERIIPHHVIHHLDLARFFLGEMEEIYTTIVRVAEGKMGYNVSLKTKSGAIANIQMSTLQDWTYPNERIEITGDQRLVVVDNVTDFYYFRPREKREGFDGYRIDDSRDAVYWSPNRTASNIFSHRGYEKEVYHFVASILENKIPAPTMENTVKTMELMETFIKSAESGVPVKMKDNRK